MQARFGHRRRAAEGHHHRVLLLVDDVERLAQQNQRQHQHRHDHRRGARLALQVGIGCGTHGPRVFPVKGNVHDCLLFFSCVCRRDRFLPGGAAAMSVSYQKPGVSRKPGPGRWRAAPGGPVPAGGQILRRSHPRSLRLVRTRPFAPGGPRGVKFPRERPKPVAPLIPTMVYLIS